MQETCLTVKRAASLIVATFLLLCIPTFVPAQPPGCLGGSPGYWSTISPTVAPVPGFRAGAFVTRMFNSFNSYEFGDANPALPTPTSRLEFPLDQWWGGLVLSYGDCAGSLNLAMMTNLNQESDPKFQESQWYQEGEVIDAGLGPVGAFTNWGPGWQKNRFIQAKCRTEQSYSLDVNVDLNLFVRKRDWGGLDLGPVIGFRYQNFLFQSYDGIMRFFPAAVDPIVLVGDWVSYQQVYNQFYVGLKGDAMVIVSPVCNLKQRVVQFTAQIDYGYVEGHGEEQPEQLDHLTRLLDTTGSATHFSVGGRLFYSEVLRLGLQFDFLRIDTAHGDVYQIDRTFGNPTSWSRGVRVWSDQVSFMGTAEVLL